MSLRPHTDRYQTQPCRQGNHCNNNASLQKVSIRRNISLMEINGAIREKQDDDGQAWWMLMKDMSDHMLGHSPGITFEWVTTCSLPCSGGAHLEVMTPLSCTGGGRQQWVTAIIDKTHCQWGLLAMSTRNMMDYSAHLHVFPTLSIHLKLHLQDWGKERSL